MGRDVCSHPDRNTRGAVQQKIRHLRGQHRGLLERSIEVGLPIHGALPKLRQQDLCISRQSGFGVTHGGERLGIVWRPPVPLSINQRIAIRKFLRHQDHRFVGSAVTVGVELANNVTNRARGLLVFGGCLKPQLAHRVNDASLHWL